MGRKKQKSSATKQEPLGLYLTKMVLTVSILVSLGTILGVSGYLIKHKAIANQNTPSNDPGNNESGKEVTFKTLAEGANSGVSQRGSYIIEDEKSWNDLWFKASLQEIAPRVDFSNNMVVAIFQGAKPTGGYSISVNNVIEGDSSVMVFVKEVSPGPNCMVTMAFTQPYHMIMLPKTDKEAIFNIDGVTNDCQ